jgi:two-component system NtrC family sensor kinase
VHKRLAAKLAFCVLILVVLVEGTGSLINVKLQEDQLLRNMIQGADQLSRSITSATWQAMLADHRGAAYEVMETIAAKQGIDRIRIFNKEGRVTFSTGPDQGTMVDERAEACFLCHAEEQPLVRVAVPSRARVFKGPNGQRRMGIVTPFYNEPACSNASCHAHAPERNVLGVLDVTLTLDQVDRDLEGIKFRAGLALSLEILLLAAFIVFFTRRFVHTPIKRLIEGTKAVSAMQLDRPIEITSTDEIGELARSFDTMRERLQASLAKNEEFTRGLEAMVEERTDQLRKAQEKLVQSGRLASLGQLAASVAHEINNPLSSVLNLSVLMQRILKDDGVPADRVGDFRRYLSQIVNETSRAGRIVKDLLAFSRRSRPQRGAVDLNAIVRNTVSLVAHKMELSNVRVELDLQDNLPAIPCDASQIQQVLMNLLLNGAESIKGTGTVKVSARKPPDEPSVILEVSDTGSGIPPEIQHKIFDPFFTTKGEGKGVGLGLAVVYGIVQSHGGDIEVESSVCEGTTFRVRLPLSVPDSPSTGRDGGSTVQERE